MVQIDPEKKKRRTRPWIRRGRAKSAEGKKPKKYRFNSITTTKRKELECIIASARQIHWAIFINKVDPKFIENYTKKIGKDLREERTAKYYRAVTLEGEEAYCLMDLGVEYIFF